MIFYLLFFIIGLAVGSFLNVLIYREAHEDLRGQKQKKAKGIRKIKNRLPSWLSGRSYCDHCRKELAWFDNIPLLSFVLLKGRCRYCQGKISLQYPIVEFITGIEFVWIYLLLKSNLAFFSRYEGFYSFLSLTILLMLSAFFLAMLVADIRYQIIPDSAVFGAIFLTFAKIYIDYNLTGMINFSQFFSSVVASLFFLGLYSLTKGKGMGLGDVKLAFLIGLILGFPKTVIAIFLAFLTGAIYGVILILLRLKAIKSKVAFGPFLILGMLIGLIWGEKIWQWYWH